jgi:DNA (cytosine-5)-methyltransferase 1
MGYHSAGFDVVGVDLHPQPNYPFEFHQGDALEFCRAHAHEFDAIHASPPCQQYSISKHIHRRQHADLVDTTRQELERARLPWVIENVMGAPLHRPIMLCGLMFGLKVLRHRIFESSEMLLGPAHPRHPKGNLTNSTRGYSTGREGFVCVAGHNFAREAGASAMGIDWMKRRSELAQAIPPAFTKFIGRQLLRQLAEARRKHDPIGGR